MARGRLRLRDALVQLTEGVAQEIARYRWLASEQAGYDIGWERAEQEWMERHFTDWRAYQWHRAVEEAVRGSGPRRWVAPPAGIKTEIVALQVA